MSDYFDRIERQLVARVQAGAAPDAGRRSRLTGPLVPALAVAVVVAIVAIVLTVGHSTRGSAPPAAGRPASASLVFTAAPGASTGALRRTAATLRARLSTVSSRLTVARRGDSVVVSGVTAGDRTSVLALAAPGRLALLDWEGDVLLPDGHTVASGLRSRAAGAIRISQGSSAGPGTADAGAMTLYDAVRLAARRPAVPGGGPAAIYLFGRSDGAACAAVAQTAVRGRRCLLAGPAPSAPALAAQLPAGVTTAGAQRLTVRPGTTVLQAASADPGRSLPPGSPAARFFVARDRPALTETALAGARVGSAQGQPDVQFSFTGAGARQFTAVTRRIAHRGAAVSGPPTKLYQHFAIALDGRLVTVPQIDFNQYPDGILLGRSADIEGGLTAQSARELVTLLRHGALDVPLTPVGAG